MMLNARSAVVDWDGQKTVNKLNQHFGYYPSVEEVDQQEHYDVEDEAQDPVDESRE
jgi:hypothetical protein